MLVQLCEGGGDHLHHRYLENQGEAGTKQVRHGRGSPVGNLELEKEHLSDEEQNPDCPLWV